MIWTERACILRTLNPEPPKVAFKCGEGGNEYRVVSEERKTKGGQGWAVWEVQDYLAYGFNTAHSREMARIFYISPVGQLDVPTLVIVMTMDMLQFGNRELQLRMMDLSIIILRD